LLTLPSPVQFNVEILAVLDAQNMWQGAFLPVIENYIYWFSAQ